MKFEKLVGFTEAGDPAQHPGWASSAIERKLGGVVCITKDPLSCWDDLTRLREEDIPVILHATITGWGGSQMEPNSPHPAAAVTATAALAKAGLVRSVILRIDPIIPTPEGCDRAVWVARLGWKVGLKQVRFGLLHLYANRRKEVLAALSKNDRMHLLQAYEGKKTKPSTKYAEAVARRLDPLAKAGVSFSCCAKNKGEVDRDYVTYCGCLDADDLTILGINTEDCKPVKQRRKGCCCLAVKTELLQ